MTDINNIHDIAFICANKIFNTEEQTAWGENEKKRITEIQKLVAGSILEYAGVAAPAARADQFGPEEIAKFQALNFPPAGLIPHLRQYLHNDGSGIVFGYDKAGVDSLVLALNYQVRHLRAAIFPPKIYDTAAWRALPMKHVLAINNLIDPPPLVVDGKTMVFRNPLAAEVLTEISKEVRAMMEAVPPT